MLNVVFKKRIFIELKIKNSLNVFIVELLLIVNIKLNYFLQKK